MKQCQERSEKIRRGYEAFKSTTTRYSLEDKLSLLRNYAKQYREEHNLPEDAPVPRPSKNHSFLFKFIQYQISDANGRHNARGNQKVQERALELLTSKVREILCQPETYWWTGKSLNQVGRKNISDKNHKTSNKTENNVREAQKEQIDPQPQKKSSRGRAIVARKDETFAYFPLKRSYKAIEKDLESTGAKKVRCEATKVSDSEGDDSTRPTVGQQELYGGLEVLAEVN